MRRWIAYLIASLLGITVIAACGNDNDSTEATDTPTATAVVTTPTLVATPVPTPAQQPPAAVLATPTSAAALPSDSDTQSTEDTILLDVPEPADLSQPAFDSSDKLTTLGLGAMKFGMTPEDAAEAIETVWTGTPEADTESCFLLAPANGPNGVVVTVYNGRIERVDITNPTISTRSGAAVGSTETQLVELFGDKLQTTPYTDGSGNTIEFVPVDESDRDYRVTFETNGSTVTSLRAGRLPAVQPTNPCG